MEKGCRKAGPDRIRLTRIVDAAGRRISLTNSSYKNSAYARQNGSLLPDNSREDKAARPQNDKAIDKASVLGGIEPAVHVPARLEGGKHQCPGPLGRSAERG